MAKICRNSLRIGRGIKINQKGIKINQAVRRPPGVWIEPAKICGLKAGLAHAAPLGRKRPLSAKERWSTLRTSTVEVPSYGWMALRWLIKALLLVVFWVLYVAGAAFIFSGDRRQTLWDRIIGTVVVDVLPEG